MPGVRLYLLAPAFKVTNSERGKQLTCDSPSIFKANLRIITPLHRNQVSSLVSVPLHLPTHPLHFSVHAYKHTRHCLFCFIDRFSVNLVLSYPYVSLDGYALCMLQVTGSYKMSLYSVCLPNYFLDGYALCMLQVARSYNCTSLYCMSLNGSCRLGR